MKKNPCLINITRHNALRQSIIGIALLSAMPAITIGYTSAMHWLNPGRLSHSTQLIICVSITIQVAAGLIIILKYPRNIIKLRQYIEELASGTLPQSVDLLYSSSSNDLEVIERGLNIIIDEMQTQVETARNQAEKERTLRETIEQQQEIIINGAQRRAMTQSIAASLHQLGKPLTILDLRLHLIRMMDHMPKKESEQLADCEQVLFEVMNIMKKIERSEEVKSQQHIDENGEDPLPIPS